MTEFYILGNYPFKLSFVLLNFRFRPRMLILVRHLFMWMKRKAESLMPVTADLRPGLGKLSLLSPWSLKCVCVWTPEVCVCVWTPEVCVCGLLDQQEFACALILCSGLSSLSVCYLGQQ